MKKVLALGCVLLAVNPACAGTKISSLPDGGNVTAGDVFPVVRGGVTRKVTYQDQLAGELGSSVSEPSPHSSAGALTGLYSTGINQVGISLNGVNALSATSTGVGFANRTTNGSVARQISDKFTAHYDAKDFGAKCDGVTDDTAAFNIGVQTIANLAGGGVLHYHGQCLVCGVEVYRNTLLDGGSIAESELKSTDGCAKHTVYSENYDNVIGTGKFYDNDPEVPSWFGIRNTRIDGNWGAIPGLHGVAFYGPAQILQNVHVRNTSGDCIKTEDSNQTVGYWSGSWGYQEEGWFDNVYAMGCGGRGWLFHGPHDSTITRFITGYNQSWGFESASDSNYNGVIDRIGEMHSYANVNYDGIKFGAGVANASHLMSDGDRILFTSGANDSIVSSITQWYCGFGDKDCLTIQAEGVTIGEHYATLGEGSQTGTNLVKWEGNFGKLGNSYLKVNGNVNPHTGLNLTGSGTTANVTVYNLTATGSLGVRMATGVANRVEGIIANVDTGLDYTAGATNTVDLTILTASGQTALSGSADPTDTFILKTGSW